MNRSSALSGLLLLLCACSQPDPDATAAQVTPSEAVAANEQAEPMSATDSAPVARAAIPINQNGETSMESPTQVDDALLRTSFEMCISQSGGVTPDMQDCIAVEAGYQDGRLASVYEALRSLLPPAERQALESEQTAWLAERKNACAWNADEEGQGQLLDAEACALEMTAKRAAQLETRQQGR